MTTQPATYQTIATEGNQFRTNPLYNMTERQRRSYFERMGYPYETAQAIAEAARFLDAFTMDHEFFDFRKEVPCKS